MNPTSACCNHAYYQVSLEKLKGVTRPLINLCWYIKMRDCIRGRFQRDNIKVAVEKAVERHEYSMICEGIAQPLLARLLSLQAVQLLTHARFTEGYHRELDKIFDHSKILCATLKPQEAVCETFEKELQVLRDKEAVYNEAIKNGRNPEQVRAAFQAWRSAFPPVYAACRKELDSFVITYKHLPKQVALTYAKLFVAHGLMQYSDFENHSPFKKALKSLKIAFLLVHYSLGFAPLSPDLSSFKKAGDLEKFSLKAISLGRLADTALKKISPEKWAEQTAALPQADLNSVLALLSYLNLTLMSLPRTRASLSDKLLEMMDKMIALGLQNPAYDQTEMKDRAAEFKYNEYSTLLARRIARLEQAGKKEEAADAREELRKLWEECINLSKDPDMMWACCLSKHPLIVETSLQDKIAMFQQSIESFLILPDSSRKTLLLTLAWDSLSHAQVENGALEEAKKSAQEAVKLAQSCLEVGYQQVQLEEVFKWAKECAALK
jgi:hypothetical protein